MKNTLNDWLKRLVPCSLGAAALAGITEAEAQLNKTYEFRSDEGMTWRQPIGGVGPWRAEGWISLRTNILGIAEPAPEAGAMLLSEAITNWRVGETVTLVTRFQSRNQLSPERLPISADFLRFGLSATPNLVSGVESSKVGTQLGMNTRGFFKIRPSDLSVRGAHYHSDLSTRSSEFVDLRVAITKTATAGEFRIVQSLSQSGQGAEEEASRTFTVSDQALYNSPTAYPFFDNIFTVDALQYGVNPLWVDALQVQKGQVQATRSKPNVIFILADDISAREFPVYGSSDFTQSSKGRARTPTFNRMAREGCFVETVWSATVCKPSRTMLMTGRYANETKWWDNAYIGRVNPRNNHSGGVDGRTYGVTSSSPLMIGHVSREAGYANTWVGKVHIAYDSNVADFGFNEGYFCFPPAGLDVPRNAPPVLEDRDGRSSFDKSFFWWPSVVTMNVPSKLANPRPQKDPNFPAFDYEDTGLSDFAPDMELDYIMDFIDRSKRNDDPFFVYYTPNLGHRSFDPFSPTFENAWPGTPTLNWNGSRYTRNEPTVRAHGPLNGRNTNYSGTNVTDEGIRYHIEYLDYQIWSLIEKLRSIGELNNTIIVFTADNGTKTGDRVSEEALALKGSTRKERGVKVPMFVYAPGFPNLVKGAQNVETDFTDVLPTLADIMGYRLPSSENYTLHGKSLWPYLTGKAETHRDWIYTFRGDGQFVRNNTVLRDTLGHWYDVRNEAGDHDSYPQINPNDPRFRQHVNLLNSQLPQFRQSHRFTDLSQTSLRSPNGPHGPLPPVDNDNDGLSDHWEQEQYVFHPTVDTDRDGFLNEEEYVMGTNPRDAASPPAARQPREITVESARGTHQGFVFTRRHSLLPYFKTTVEVALESDQSRWTSRGVVQQFLVRPLPGGIEEVTAVVQIPNGPNTPDYAFRLEITPFR